MNYPGQNTSQIAHAALPSKQGVRSAFPKPITDWHLPISPRTCLFLTGHYTTFIPLLFVMRIREIGLIVQNHQGYHGGKRYVMDCKKNCFKAFKSVF